MNTATTPCRRLVALAAVVGLSGILLVATSSDGIAGPKSGFDASDIEIERAADNVIDWADQRALGSPLQPPTLPIEGTRLSVILWDERRGVVKTGTGDTGRVSSYIGNVQTTVNGLQFQ